MKRIIVFLLAACGSQDVVGSASDSLTTTASKPLEGFESRQILISETPVPLTVTLNDQTVLCSHADYAQSVLKVVIPELAVHTLYNHQNTGAGGPCMAAGVCDADLSADTILDPNKPSESIVISVRLMKRFFADHEQKNCRVSLIEHLETEIRGIAFTHDRFGDQIVRDYADCVAVFAQTKADL